MCGGKICVTAISGPHVMPVEPVRISPSANSPSGNDDGLKTCARRPSLFQRTSSLTAKPTATIRNWSANQSGLNHMNRLMLKMIGNGPNPST